jgi:hypothetical protein
MTFFVMIRASGVVSSRASYSSGAAAESGLGSVPCTSRSVTIPTSDPFSSSTGMCRILRTMTTSTAWRRRSSCRRVRGSLVMKSRTRTL